MGTVVFPDAACKFFIQADPEERAHRRLQQLKKQHVHATVAAISQDLAQRDTRDQQRQNAPLKPAADAIVLDTTSLTVEQSLALVMHHVATRLSLNLDESGR
jgi:cytidylate kinase